MSPDIIILSALLALNIVMGYKAVTSYGGAKYMKGKLDGFIECSDLHKKIYNKLKEEYDARNKTKAKDKGSLPSDIHSRASD